MHKRNLQPYFVVFFALFIVILTPKKTQNILRSQFIRPLCMLSILQPEKRPPLIPSLPSVEKKEPPPTFFPDSIQAKIIYRTPTFWNDFFWIAAGECSNKNSPKIALNSPVLHQNTLIGIVDYVGKKQSRVKLITSSSLTVSVRALRGGQQYYDLLNHIQSLLNYQCIQNSPVLLKELGLLKQKLAASPKSTYLAKGELTGLSKPLWRADSKIMMGKGFNCSTEDHLSIARELITGKPLHSNEVQTPLILPDDLLLTTGFDGIFPEGLVVAKALTVSELDQGSFYYSISAAPLITDLDNLNQVEVILPVNFDAKHLKF